MSNESGHGGRMKGADRDPVGTDKRAARGELFILSAPSGAGKTTLVHRAMELMEGVEFSISHTTRRPRENESDGIDYHFVDRGRFDRMVAEDRFLEWAEVHGHCYGTSVDEVLPRIERAVDVLLDIDVQGAAQVMSRPGGASGVLRTGVWSIFVMPPSYEALVSRLRGRDLDDAPAIAKRLKGSLAEVGRVWDYDYVIVNDRAEAASEILAAIILEKRQRRERMRERVSRVLADFHSYGTFS